MDDLIPLFDALNDQTGRDVPEVTETLKELQKNPETIGLFLQLL